MLAPSGCFGRTSSLSRRSPAPRTFPRSAISNGVDDKVGMLHMRSANKKSARWVCAAVVFGLLLPATLFAHPGSGIVVDRLGEVYFIDTGAGLWKIDAHGTLVKITAPRFHWLTLDAEDRFASARLPSGASGDVTRVGSKPALLLSSDYPLAIGRGGGLFYPL